MPRMPLKWVISLFSQQLFFQNWVDQFSWYCSLPLCKISINSFELFLDHDVHDSWTDWLTYKLHYMGPSSRGSNKPNNVQIISPTFTQFYVKYQETIMDNSWEIFEKFISSIFRTISVQPRETEWRLI